MLTAARTAIQLAGLRPDRRAWLAAAWAEDLPAEPDARWRALPRGGRTLLAHQGGWLLAQGGVWQTEADGPGRSAWLGRAQVRLEACTVIAPAAGGPALPFLLTALAFEPAERGSSHWGWRLPAARLWMPQRWWWRQPDGRGWCGGAVQVAADDDPARVVAALNQAPPTTALPDPAPWPRLPADYTALVEEGVSLIGDGALRKVVVARAVDEPCHADEATILARLRAGAGPGTTVYAQDLDDGGLFCGATPEVLLECQGDRLRTMALAGSCPRGADDAEDLAQMADMLTSTKQRKEHGVVVEHLAAVLRPRSKPFTIAPTPHQRSEGPLLHLETLVETELSRRDYLEVAGALHPTPAVCGLPTATATHFIHRHEHLHRGLYAGALGWLGPDACRLVVPLRGGILAPDRTRARLFAGAGIVETSDPAAELAETELKLRPMRNAIA